MEAVSDTRKDQRAAVETEKRRRLRANCADESQSSFHTGTGRCDTDTDTASMPVAFAAAAATGAVVQAAEQNRMMSKHARASEAQIPADWAQGGNLKAARCGSGLRVVAVAVARMMARGVGLRHDVVGGREG